MSKRSIIFLFLILISGIGQIAVAQIADPESRDEMFTIDTPVTIELEDDEEEEEEYLEPKKKKRKKNVFYGLKTKKRFSKEGYGDKVTYELFHVLKEHVEPDPYVRDIYW
ncbi:MAG: hypothetical protein R3345_07530, partial [Fulvivirga sp.]|nr:hypothetical protein [Fulvivirga sp.]